MLNLDRNLLKIIFISFFWISGCNGCHKESTDLSKKNQEYKKYSQKIVTNEVYNNVYNEANDSINRWIKGGLNSVGFLSHDKWQLDSLICFNKNANKVIMCFNVQSNYPKSTSDDLHFFYGVKIKDNWYFFSGATVYLPRSIYQNDTHTPLSFTQLHEIAMQEIFNGYLIKDDKGIWQVNDRFFDDITSKAYCSTCKTEEEFEKVWLGNVAANWANRDTTNYKK